MRLCRKSFIKFSICRLSLLVSKFIDDTSHRIVFAPFYAGLCISARLRKVEQTDAGTFQCQRFTLRFGSESGVALAYVVWIVWLLLRKKLKDLRQLFKIAYQIWTAIPFLAFEKY